ncbi:MAG: heavy-metal-associated domain-containing protein, partial [Mesonia sp.]
MKHTYHIEGMTCNGCRKHVEDTLSKVKGVTEVSVDLENEQAEIEMESHIPLEKFQKALENDGGGYSISANKTSQVLETCEVYDKENPDSKQPMAHTYHIGGMSCNGCRKHVEETLSNVKGVSKVSLDLEKEQAQIEMERHVPLEKLREALKNDGGGYSISANKTSQVLETCEVSNQENPDSKQPMKHTYYVGGMSCNGCRKHVEETLSNVKGVSKVSLD